MTFILGGTYAAGAVVLGAVAVGSTVAGSHDDCLMPKIGEVLLNFSKLMLVLLESVSDLDNTKLSEEIDDIYIPLDPQERSPFPSLGAVAQVAHGTQP